MTTVHEKYRADIKTISNLKKALSHKQHVLRNEIIKDLQGGSYPDKDIKEMHKRISKMELPYTKNQVEEMYDEVARMANKSKQKRTYRSCPNLYGKVGPFEEISFKRFKEIYEKQPDVVNSMLGFKPDVMMTNDGKVCVTYDPKPKKGNDEEQLRELFKDIVEPTDIRKVGPLLSKVKKANDTRELKQQGLHTEFEQKDKSCLEMSSNRKLQDPWNEKICKTGTGPKCEKYKKNNIRIEPTELIDWDRPVPIAGKSNQIYCNSLNDATSNKLSATTKEFLHGLKELLKSKHELKGLTPGKNASHAAVDTFHRAVNCAQANQYNCDRDQDYDSPLGGTFNPSKLCKLSKNKRCLPKNIYKTNTNTLNTDRFATAIQHIKRMHDFERNRDKNESIRWNKKTSDNDMQEGSLSAIRSVGNAFEKGIATLAKVQENDPTNTLGNTTLDNLISNSNVIGSVVKGFNSLASSGRKNLNTYDSLNDNKKAIVDVRNFMDHPTADNFPSLERMKNESDNSAWKDQMKAIYLGLSPPPRPSLPSVTTNDRNALVSFGLPTPPTNTPGLTPPPRPSLPSETKHDRHALASIGTPTPPTNTPSLTATSAKAPRALSPQEQIDQLLATYNSI